MKKVIAVAYLFLFAILFTACKKTNDPQTTPTSLEFPAGVTTKNVQIILPQNSTVDLGNCKLFSLSLTSPVDKEGNVKAAFDEGNPNIAYLFDKNKNLILAGFITDSTNTISVASTAEVLLYSGMGISFEPYEVRQTFINSIGKIEGVSKWKAKLEDIFKSDPLMLKKGLFIESLKEALTSLKKNGAILRKPADITVDANDIRSGLQLAEDGLDHFTITNTFRRRAYAFVYKTSYTDLDGMTHSVNSDITGDVAPISETKISPTTAIRGWAGTMQSWMASYMAGKQLEFASTTTDPIDIPLEDNELLAKFRVRIVGPGMPSYITMTSKENERWKNLALQTVLFDYMMPILLDAMGHNEILQKMNSSFALGKNLENLQKLNEACGLLIEAIPAASDALEAGDYGKVVTEVFFSIANGRAGINGGKLLKLVYESIGDYVKKNGSDYYKDPSAFEDRLENLNSVLEILDMGLKFVDYLRITKAIADSKTLEEWNLVAKEVQLNIDPKEFTINPLKQKKLTAYIKTSLGDDNPAIGYDWETTGTYGYLQDDRGHQGNAFSSSLNQVDYYCNAKDDLGDGEHTDTIKVTAYIKKGQTKTKIATGISLAKVKKNNSSAFTVALEGHVSITKLGGSYHASNPYFTAEFPEKKDAKTYSISIVRKDGSKAPANVYTPSQLGSKDGVITFRLGIGSIFIKDGLSEAQMLEEKARQEKMLKDYGATAIYVTVGY